MNPYNTEDMTSALSQALQMPKEEQRRRMQAMQNRIKAEDILWWAKEFLSPIAKAEPAE